MSLTIYERVADCEQPLFVIAELGLNHGGDVERALRLVDGAARAGAAAIKVQALRADRLVAPACPAPAHVEARSLRAFFQGYELDADALARIASRAHALGLAAVATPFDEDVVGVLESAGYDAYKIASGDLTYTALIERAAMTGKPVLMSTGMSDMDDIRVAMEHARAAGGRQLGLLHCVSAYPTPSGQENLAALTQIRRAFGVEVGLSDHSTEPLSIPMAARWGPRSTSVISRWRRSQTRSNVPCPPRRPSWPTSLPWRLERGLRWEMAGRSVEQSKKETASQADAACMQHEPSGPVTSWTRRR